MVRAVRKFRGREAASVLCLGLQPHFSDILLVVFYSVSWICKMVTSSVSLLTSREKKMPLQRTSDKSTRVHSDDSL